jgi:hypothetical protein
MEFLKICQAVGVGFTVMGAVGYLVKLGKRGCDAPPPQALTCRGSLMLTSNGAVHIPVNNILVGAA